MNKYYLYMWSLVFCATVANLSKRELFEKAVSLVGLSKFKVRRHINFGTAVLSSNQNFESPKTFGVSVQSLQKMRKY